MCIPSRVWKAAVLGLVVGAALLLGPRAAAAQIPVDLAARGEAVQNPLELPAKLNVEDLPLDQALTILQARSGVSLVYSRSRLPRRAVSCQCLNARVGEALDRLLEDSGARYSVYAGHVVIEPPEVAPQPGPRSAELALVGDVAAPDVRTELLSLPAPEAIAPPKLVRLEGTITGRVLDAQTRAPIASAQVFIGEGGIGALTRSDGGYMLVDVPAGVHTLQIQRIGYRSESREVTVVDGQSLVLNVEMSQVALALDEIVITGTAGGTQRRALGTVVERVDVAVLRETSPASNFEQVLSSRSPGVILNSGGGTVGSGAQIRIRGSSSVALSGDPIIYVDGVRIDTEHTIAARDASIGRLNDINPADIESIEILKGPAASTLYGTEAANGVIQITTKRGAEGPASFDASAEVGTMWLQDPRDKIVPMCYFPDDATEMFCYNLYDSEQRPERFGKPMFKSGQVQKYNLSVQGGSPTFRYFASLNRSDLDGVTYRDWDKRTSGRVSLFLSATETLNLTLNASTLGATTRNPGNVWRNMTSGIADQYDGPTGGFRDQSWTALLEGREDIVEVNRNTWSLELSHQPNTWLTNRIVAGMDETFERNDVITFRDPEGHGPQFGVSGREGRKTVNVREAPVRTLDVASTASLSLTNQLTSATSSGLQYYNRTRKRSFAQGDNFAVGALTTVSAAAVRTGGEEFLENTSLGVYLQQQFDWANRIFLTGALRADDNSAFGSEFDAAVYPKLSATWVVSEEPFWSSDFVTSFRLRGAWGAAGQQPDAFAGETLYNTVTGPGNQPVVTPASLGNTSLGPERSEEIEVGFDGAFWDDRVQLQFTSYSRRTKDAIVQRPVTESTGFPGTQLLNIGQVSAWGTETALDLRLLDRAALGWNLNVAFTTMGNRIDDLGGEADLPVGSSRSQRHVEGYPLAGFHDFRLLSADFVNGNSGPVTNLMCDGGTGPDGRQMGGEAVPCEVAPRVYYGQPEPKWTVNLGSTVTLFQDWQLYANVDARGGNMSSHDLLGALHNRSSRAIMEQTDPLFMGYQIISRSPPVHHDNGFARLREVSLRYNLPDAMAQRIGARRASILVGGYNVALLWWEQRMTRHGGERAVDPEMYTSEDNFPGEVRGGMPPTSQLTIKANVSF